MSQGMKEVDLESLFGALKKDGEAKLSDHTVDKAQEQKTVKKKVTETPLMRQYAEMKVKHPDALLLFRVGDFYETFSEDAVAASEVLGLTLTRRSNGPGKYVELVGFPHHALDTYLPKLVRAGKRVAICEQLEYPKLKKTTRQKVVETVTPNRPTTPESKVEPKEAEKQKETEGKKMSLADLVTVNGEKVTAAHAFEWRDHPELRFFTAKLEGKRLRPQKMEPTDAEKYERGEISTEELMRKYYPTKMLPKVTEESYSFPLSHELPSGEVLNINKFNVYKEKNPESSNLGKWMFYADVDGQKMSVPGTSELLSAYFDRTETAGSLVCKLFGAKLHLKAHYDEYKLPEGLTIDSIRIKSEPIKGTKQWAISVALPDGRETGKKAIAYDDAHSYWREKTADRAQIASKYFYDELKQMIKTPLKQDKKNEVSPKR